jgi:glycosyltransferase involved in cell wall biosynthesis
MEQGRNWKPNWGDLPVTVQRTLTWNQVFQHPAGFTDRGPVHLPIDTLAHLGRFRPDVVITGELGLRSLSASLHCLRSRNAALVLWATLSEHTEASRGPLRKLLRRYLTARTDVVIVNGESGARYMTMLGMSPKRIIKMPQPVDISAFQGKPTRTPPSSHRLLYVGRLIELKGVLPFLRALAHHAATVPMPIEVWLAGDGPLRAAIESMPRPANLHVRMLGHVSYNALSEVYMSCGILMFPTLSDEWGLVVNEALAAGLPVLGSIYSQAVDELIENGITGWTFDPLEASSVARAIQRSITAPANTLDAMRARGIAAVDKITPSRMAQRMVKACQLALRLRRGGAAGFAVN